MRALVLINDAAGAAEPAAADQDPSEGVRAAIERAGLAADVRAVEPQRMTDTARRAAASGAYDAVIAGGGDGTVSAVASALVGSNVALGVLPLGTLNHFAKNLGMPLALDEACAAVARATVRAIDVGEVNGHVFLNNASIGLYPRLVGNREQLQRRRFASKWLAMVFAALGVLRRFPALRVRLTTDDQTIHRDTSFIFVGNGRYEFSLLAVGERPCLDAGELGLYFAGRAGRFASIRLALRALLGRLEQSSDFESATVKEFSLETGRRHLHVAMDGEVRNLAPPLHFRSRPGALRILAPPGFRATRDARPGPAADEAGDKL
jgi:diacylglycerol kinase family enzyme